MNTAWPKPQRKVIDLDDCDLEEPVSPPGFLTHVALNNLKERGRTAKTTDL